MTTSITDDARRASDLVNLYRAYVPWDDLCNKWLAIRLSDGTSDSVLYDSKRDAVRHQSDEFQCAYMSFRNLGPAGTTPKEMQSFLDFCRKAYDAGFRLPDPDDRFGGPDLIQTTGLTDYLRNRARPRPLILPPGVKL